MKGRAKGQARAGPFELVAGLLSGTVHIATGSRSGGGRRCRLRSSPPGGRRRRRGGRHCEFPRRTRTHMAVAACRDLSIISYPGVRSTRHSWAGPCFGVPRSSSAPAHPRIRRSMCSRAVCLSGHSCFAREDSITRSQRREIVFDRAGSHRPGNWTRRTSRWQRGGGCSRFVPAHDDRSDSG